MRRRLAALLAAVLLLGGCKDESPREEITVSAASSLREALTEAAQRYEAAHPGVEVHLNFGSSGALQQQIERGAPVDLFLSAAEQEMDALQKKGLVDPRTRRDFAQNELVLVVPKSPRVPVRGFAALAHADVELGEADAGLVYRTDAASSSRVTVVATAPPGSHTPISYPLAVVSASPHPDEARDFADYLLSPEGRQVLERFGFRAPG